MNTTIVPKFIVNLFAQEIERIHKLLLYEISKDYNISLSELESRYISNVSVSTEKIQIVKKRDYNVNLENTKRCCALNAKGKQCQRSKGNHDVFCPIHKDNNKYGTIDKNGFGQKVKKKWEKIY